MQIGTCVSVYMCGILCMSKSILVVDDSAMMRKVVIKSLKNCGVDIEVVEAADGALGLTAFNKQDFDIVVTDWNMPNMNGLELIKAIRATDKGKKTPIVMVTTEGSVDKVKQGILAGANDYLAKPFDNGRFVAKFQKLLV